MFQPSSPCGQCEARCIETKALYLHSEGKCYCKSASLSYILWSRVFCFQTLTGPNRHHDFILNMDQALIPFSLHRKWSLNSHGTCMVDIPKSIGDTRHATLVVMATASGRMLLPFLIFKVSLEGQIEWEFSTFPKTGFMPVKKMHGWMSML